MLRGGVLWVKCANVDFIKASLTLSAGRSDRNLQEVSARPGAKSRPPDIAHSRREVYKTFAVSGYLLVVQPSFRTAGICSASCARRRRSCTPHAGAGGPPFLNSDEVP